MIGFKSHSGDTQSSRSKKAHDNPVYGEPGNEFLSILFPRNMSS
jgi:hypothetical protein